MENKYGIFVVKVLHFSIFLGLIWTWTLCLKIFLDLGCIWTDF